MKLRRDDGAFLHHADKGRVTSTFAAVAAVAAVAVRCGVVGRPENPLVVRLRGRHVEGVDKVEAVGGGEDGAAPLAVEVDAVPPDVRHGGALAPVELVDRARDDPEALHARRLLARLEQDLHAEADADVGAPRLQVLAQRLHQTLLPEVAHDAPEAAHAREEEDLGGVEVGGLGHVDHVEADAFDRVSGRRAGESTGEGSGGGCVCVCVCGRRWMGWRGKDGVEYE